MNETTITAYGLLFTGLNGEESDHSLFLTWKDAATAGDEMAREIWPDCVGGTFPDVELKMVGDGMDMLRCNASVQFEAEPIEISPAVIRARCTRPCVKRAMMSRSRTPTPGLAIPAAPIAMGRVSL